ncbi:MAG: lysophospholipid acyltransferase family protein [Weeksellaceae bacterium]
MQAIRKTLTIFWKCWFYLLTGTLVILIGVCWVYPLSFSSKTFPLAYKGIRLWAILIFYGSGFQLSVERNKTLDKNRPYIFIANHTSILDIMVMAIIHPHHPVVFVGKEELARLPIFGRIYRRICIVVDRSDIRSRTHVYKLAKERINENESLVIFPEGGIPPTETQLQKFKDGPFTIGITAKTPIAVYSIKGLKTMFPEAFFKGRPGKVKVKLLDIIQTENLSLDDKNTVKAHCFDIILTELNS